MPKSGEDVPLQAKVMKTRSVGEHNLVGGPGRLDSPCQGAGKCEGFRTRHTQHMVRQGCEGNHSGRTQLPCNVTIKTDFE